MKNKSLVFSLAFLGLMQQDCARATAPALDPLMTIPQEAFNVQADHMTMQELHRFAQTSKDSLARVKNYFAFGRNIFENTKCPVLTKEMINKIIEEGPKEVLPSFYTPRVMSPDDSIQVWEIDGVRWIYDASFKKEKIQNIPDQIKVFIDRFTSDKQKDGVSMFQHKSHICEYRFNDVLEINLQTGFDDINFDALAAPPQ